MNIRKAKAEEAAYLSDLSFRSKAYWGYSDEFMEACRDDLTLSVEDMVSALVFVLEDEGAVRGFMSLEMNQDTCLLDNFFIAPEAIGKGYGKALWRYMIEIVEGLGVRTVMIHSDPHAENFYLAMGALRTGETESTVFPGRKLPLMEVKIGHGL